MLENDKLSPSKVDLETDFEIIVLNGIRTSVFFSR